MKEILIGIGIALAILAFLAFFFYTLFRGFIWPLLKLLKKLVIFFWKYPSSLVLVAANAVPLVGVFVLDWKLFEVLFLYWLEVVVYSFFSIEKLKKVLAHTPHGNVPNIRITPFVIRRGRGVEETLQRIIPDFKATFRFTAIGALVLIVVLSGISSTEPWFAEEKSVRFSFEFLDAPLNFLLTSLLALSSFSISHGFSYVRNFLGKEEYRRLTLREQLKAPLERLGVMWVAILFGSMLTIAFGTPRAALIFLVLLKTAFDITSHIREHDKFQTAQSTKTHDEVS